MRTSLALHPFLLILVGILAACAAAPPAGEPTPSVAAEDLPLPDGEVGATIQAKAGRTAEWTCWIDEPQRIGVTLTLDGRGASVEPLADGDVAVPKLDLQQDEFAPDHLLISHELDVRALERVRFRLTAGAGDAAARIAIQFHSGKPCLVRCEPLVAERLSTPVFLGARVVGPRGETLDLARAVWTCTVEAPGGTRTPVPLYDDGLHADGLAHDGSFGGFTTEAITTAPGRYSATFECSGRVGERLVMRSSWSEFTVHSGDVQTVGPPVIDLLDEDHDQLVDGIACTYACRVARAGTYTVVGNLLDRKRRVVAHYTSSVAFEKPGDAQLVLRFDAGEVVWRGVPSPWTVDDALVTAQGPDHAVVCTPQASTPFDVEWARLQPPGPPVITNIEPTSGPRAGGQRIEITGKALFDTYCVRVGSVVADFRQDRDDLLHVTVPADTVGPPYPRAVSIFVITKWGSVESKDAYVYRP